MRLKRVLSGLLACAVTATMLSAFAMTASAADSVSVSVGTATAAAGETFSVDVSLTSVPAGGIAALELAVGFDSSALTITSVTAGAIADTGAAAAELALNSGLSSTMVSGSEYSCFDYAILSDQVSLTWVTAMTDTNYWLKTNGVLCTITGTVNADAAEGTYPLSIEAINRETSSGSGTYNTSLYFAAVDANLATTYYTVNKTAGSVTVGGSAPAGMLGDVTLDGQIDIRDVALLAKVAAGTRTLTDAQALANADVTGDGNIDIRDVAKLAKVAAGVVTL